jgi:hypothetical protein
MLAMNLQARGLDALQDDSRKEQNTEAASAPKAEPATSTASAIVTPEEIRKQGVAAFMLRQVGVWTPADAKASLGDPINHRYVYDENKSLTNNVFSYKDPSGMSPLLEISFGAKTDKMVAAYLYPPPGATWENIKKIWGDEVTVKKNPDGTKFHNYKNARVNVKLDKQNKVLGIVIY